MRAILAFPVLCFATAVCGQSVTISKPTLYTSGSILASGASKSPQFAVDPAAGNITASWDITNNGAGNLSSTLMTIEISTDGGLTWRLLVSAGRDKGYAPLLDKNSVPITTATVGTGIPQGNNTLVRTTLTVGGAPIMSSVTLTQAQ